MVTDFVLNKFVILHQELVKFSSVTAEFHIFTQYFRKVNKKKSYSTKQTSNFKKSLTTVDSVIVTAYNKPNF